MTVSIEQAQASLGELIQNLSPGEELVITRDNQPVAKIISTTRSLKGSERQLGTLQGTVLYMAPDFDTPLEDFKEYM